MTWHDMTNVFSRSAFITIVSRILWIDANPSETRARFAASLCARIWLGVAVFRTNSLSLIVVYKTFYRNLQNLFKSISLRISCSLLMFSPVQKGPRDVFRPLQGVWTTPWYQWVNRSVASSLHRSSYQCSQCSDLRLSRYYLNIINWYSQIIPW